MSCASSNSVQTAKPIVNHLISVPARGSLVFLGVSGPQLKPELEVEAAREDAARKVSMYHGLTASFSNVQGSGSNALEYYSDLNFQLEYNTQLDPYKERLTHDPERDVSHGDNMVYILFSYPGTYPVSINYTSAKERDGSPEWIKSPPLEIGGFMAQVGFARRQYRLRDTIARSSEDAIAQLIARSSSSMSTSDISRNELSSSFFTQQSRGRLLNFMILETWIDLKDLSVWTLTVAKSAN